MKVCREREREKINSNNKEKNVKITVNYREATTSAASAAEEWNVVRGEEKERWRRKKSVTNIGR
jgi:hypothetical protein